MPANINIYGKANVEEWNKVTKKAAEMRQATIKDAAVMGAGMIAAGAAIIAGLNMATDAAVTYGSQVVTVQRLTGLGAAESSKWAAILGRYGVEGKSAGLVIKSLDTAIVGHNQALAAAGIATVDSQGKNRDATAVLADLAQYYSTATDKTAATALAAKVLGKGYMALLPILANGAAGIDDVTQSAIKAGLIFSQDSVDAVKAYSKALKDNEMASKGLEIQTGLMILPLKTALVQTLGEVLGWFTRLDPSVKQTIVVIAGLAAGVLILSGFILTLGLVSSAATTALATTATIFAGTAVGAVSAAFAVGGLSAAMSVAGVATMGLTAKVASLNLSLVVVAAPLAVFAATLMRTDTVSSYEQAVYGLEGGMKDLNNRVTTGVTTWADAKKALDEGAGATLSVAQKASIAAAALAEANGATDELAAGQSDLATTTAELTKETKGYTDELIYQVNYLTKSQTANQTALQDKIAVKSATKALSDAMETYGKNSNEARLARLNLTEAENKAKDSAAVAKGATDSTATSAGRAAIKWDLLTDAIKRAASALKANPSAAVRVPGTQILLAAGGIIRRATSAIVGEAGPEVVIPLTDRVRAMQLMLESGLTSLVAPSFAGGGSPSLAFAGAGSSHSVVIAEGAVQIAFPSGTTATVEDVRAIVKAGLKQLADQVARR